MSNILLNNYKTVLANPAGAADTQLYVSHSLPPLSGDDYYLLTLFSRVGVDEANWEIVKVISAGGSILSVVRGQQGTVSRNWALDTEVEMRLTASQVMAKSDVGHLHSVADVQGLQNSLELLSNAIVSLGTSQGEIAQDTSPSLTLDTSNQTLAFSVTSPSSNDSMFELDGINNTITFNTDANYTFMSTVTFKSTTSNARTITFRLVDVSTDTVVGIQTAEVEIPGNDIETIPFNTLLTVGKNGVPNAPLTIRVEATANGTGIAINQFDSIITSGSAYDIGSFIIDDSIITTTSSWSSDKISSFVLSSGDYQDFTSAFDSALL
jgi:hypothetical protein